MEIVKYAKEYRKHDPAEFFNWIAQGRVMEVRFLSNYLGEKFRDWDLIQTLGEELGLDIRYNSIFITEFSHLRKILLYKIGKFPLTRLYNIFVSVNPKRKVYLKGKNGLLYQSYYGGIAGTSHVQNILCDIEHVGEREGNATEAMLEECIQGAKYLVKILKLTDFYINVSGNGVHLWMRLEKPIELPVPELIETSEKNKFNLKVEPIVTFIKTYNRFIEKLNKILQKYNPELKVDDGAKDIARIARPTGSWNVKVGKTARAVGTAAKEIQINIGLNNQFWAAKPLLNKKSKEDLKSKSLSKHHRYNAINIRESPIYQLMVSKLLPSTLSRNHYLEQSFARLLRDNDLTVEEVSDAIGEVDVIQQKTIQVDPDYLGDKDTFNAETINAYCYGCRINFIYDIMEDVPPISDGFISESHYNNLNTYSDITVKTMLIKNLLLTMPNSYFDLKVLIRNLVDKYERYLVFFTLKNMFMDEWEYFDKNKIILRMLNKTRRRIE